ncbi:MAG: GlsB/YeaQ/YmgE family stress response membrane protein [Chloroflexota bacterium]
MGILSWLILGLLAGWIASMIMGDGGYGVLGDIVVGIVGALVGGWLSSVVLGIDVTGFDLTSLLIAVVGSVILIALYRALFPSRRTMP